MACLSLSLQQPLAFSAGVLILAGAEGTEASDAVATPADASCFSSLSSVLAFCRAMAPEVLFASQRQQTPKTHTILAHDGSGTRRLVAFSARHRTALYGTMTASHCTARRRTAHTGKMRHITLHKCTACAALPVLLVLYSFHKLHITYITFFFFF